ncbi:hypothetical protein [Curtobacterium sp. MCBA15_008]|uniref:hypothetical protein n=1 Tax=Curtobacterium sp. MCBA15_008 TaxID=1898736 RepID=UPI001587AE54|nr:hypothetical protein [Curtobacterium sp. MCBA15_008]
MGRHERLDAEAIDWVCNGIAEERDGPVPPRSSDGEPDQDESADRASHVSPPSP